MKNLPDKNQLTEICKKLRYNILRSTTAAGSGHPSSSMSATELMAILFFGGLFKYDIKNPDKITNDKVIFSKGHAAPLLYSLFEVAGGISEEELLSLRKFGSKIEGHPTPNFPFADVATGSLGQGLSVGLGMALGLKKKMASYSAGPSNVYVLLGDSEFVEGQIWEALQLASYYKLNNLIGILDVNRLGQRGETMLGWDLDTYEKRITSFGWNVVKIKDGEDLEEIYTAYQKVSNYISNSELPSIIIAKTKKGQGVSFLSDQDNWHGKSLPENKMEEAVRELGDFNRKLKIDLNYRQEDFYPKYDNKDVEEGPDYELGSSIATREAYGDSLVRLGGKYPDLAVLDAETSNSTFAEKFKNKFPDRFFEMFIGEQNMISVALGLSKIGFVPYVSSFAAFLTRGFDQIRMAQYSEGNLKVVGSHAGVSIGADGSSQMGLEDLSMMKSILEGIVLYPSDAVSTFYLVKEIYNINNISYLRLTREKTPVLYGIEEQFRIGGSKVLRSSENDQGLIITAGITLHEALKAYDKLKEKGIDICVVDAYSIKPIDKETIVPLVNKIKKVVVVEDHYPSGGLGESVLQSISGINNVQFIHLAVNQIPHSGKPQELLEFEKIDAKTIMSIFE
jgi:transketolase